MTDWLDEINNGAETEEQKDQSPDMESVQEFDGNEEIPEDTLYEEDEYEDEYEQAEQDDYGENEQEDEPADEDDEPDESAYIMKLLDYLEETLNKPVGGTLITKPKVDVDICLDIISNIRENIPRSIEYSYRMSEEKERLVAKQKRECDRRENASKNEAKQIVDDAKEKARNIVDDAKQQKATILDEAHEEENEIIRNAERRAKELTGETEIVKRAQIKAREMLEKAKAEARQTYLSAVQFKNAMLSEMYNDLCDKAEALNNEIKNLGLKNNQ